MSKLKVFGGYGFLPGVDGQIYIIVAAKNQKEAAKLLGISLYQLRTYYTETGNQHAIATATAKPGAIFYGPMSHYGYRQFKEYHPKQEAKP